MLNQEIKDEIIRFRHTLHQIPEIGYQEIKTQKFIKNELLNLGFQVEEVAKTGLVAIKRGKKHQAIAFRADMDALAVTEKTNIDYQSKHVGRMHACGHDGHMSILLGFALYISQMELNHDIVLIFQPAEEGPGGAKQIIDEGILQKYHVEKIFGLHLFPDIEEGKIGLTDGVLMGKVGEFDLTINAVSSHGAMPHNGVDGIVVAANLIQAYQSIISRNVNPIDGGVVTIGTISGGEARNIIAGKVELNGTMRAFKEETFELIKNRMTEINQGLSKTYGIEIQMDFRDLYPSVVNDHALYLMMKDFLNKEEIIELKPMMIAEDFSFYQKEIPGYFMMLGTRNEELGYTHPLHSCYFNFKESILFKGVETYIRICQTLNIF